MAFVFPQKVLFKHCDPAGIVFYPRIFEMINDAVEAFFAEALDWPFEAIHPRNAVPTVAIDTTFQAPSRHGDRLDLHLTPTKIGTSSLALRTQAMAGSDLRFEAAQTLVFLGDDARPCSWPSEIRQRLQTLMEARP